MEKMASLEGCNRAGIMQRLVRSREQLSSNSHSEQKSRRLPFCLTCEISVLEDPKLDLPCGLGSQSSPPDQPQDPSAGRSGGICLPVPDDSKPCVREAMESGFSLPSHVLPLISGYE